MNGGKRDTKMGNNKFIFKTIYLLNETLKRLICVRDFDFYRLTVCHILTSTHRTYVHERSTE